MNGLWKKAMEAVVVALAVAGVVVAGGPRRAGRPPRGGRARMTKAELIGGKRVPAPGPRVNRAGPAQGNPVKRGYDGKGDNGLRHVRRHGDAWDRQNNPRRFGGGTPKGVFDPGAWGLYDSPGDDRYASRAARQAVLGFQVNASGNDEEGPRTVVRGHGWSTSGDADDRPTEEVGSHRAGIIFDGSDTLTGGAGISFDGGDTFPGSSGIIIGGWDSFAGSSGIIVEGGDTLTGGAHSYRR